MVASQIKSNSTKTVSCYKLLTSHTWHLPQHSRVSFPQHHAGLPAAFGAAHNKRLKAEGLKHLLWDHAESQRGKKSDLMTSLSALTIQPLMPLLT